MDKNEFLQAQMSLIQIGRILNTIDLEEFVSQMENAKENPITDPVMKLKAENSMKVLINLGKTLKPAKLAFQNVFATVMATQEKEKK
jgi:hypothetical protein